MHDLVIAGGTVVDGTGAPARTADVAVRDGRVVEVGHDVGRARRTVDADGALVIPGWVDVHTHYDAQVTWDPYVTPSSWHGVTTVVMGNCGVGFAPAAPDRHDWLIGLMEGVEDIPGSAMTEGMTWGWETFPEYLDTLDAGPRVLDVGAYVAHGPLRAYVMGERGAANEPATHDELATMSALVEQALRAGALGFSTSRTPIHRSRDGELVPGTTAEAAELFALGDALRRAGHGIFQFAPEHARVPVDEWPWMRELARRSGRTVCVNLNQPFGAPEVWREVLGLLERAHAEHLPIVAQVAGRAIGVLECLEGSLHPLALHPAWRELAPLDHAARVARLRDPAVRAAFLAEPDDGGFFASAVLARLDRTFLVDAHRIDYEPDGDASVAAEATRRREPPMAVVLDELLADEGRGLLYVPFFNYAYGDLSMTYELLQHPHTRNGLSDAGAHCGAICDGGTPTFLLTHWARDRRRGPRLGLELLVRRQTWDTARLVGLLDRGRLVPGARADLNVVDFDGLGFDRPRMAHDLPAGGRRLVQRASGYLATVCAGRITVERDEPTGELPGRLVRGPQPEPGH